MRTDDGGKPIEDDLAPCSHCGHIYADHDVSGMCCNGLCRCERFDYVEADYEFKGE